MYKHDPHSREESRLNLVIEDYLFEEVEAAPLNAHLNIKIHFDNGKDGDLEAATYFLYGWREGGARFNYAIRLKNANVSIE